MYPETDLPPVAISRQHLDALKATLPPLPDVAVKGLMERYAINRKLAEQLLDSDYLAVFEKAVEETSVASTFIASALTETLKSLEREGVPVEELSDDTLLEIFKLIDKGRMGKETFPEVAAWTAKNKAAPEDALAKLGIKMLTANELEALVEKTVNENPTLLEGDPRRAFDQLMKRIMSQVRGKADTKLLMDLIRQKLSERNA